MFVCHGNICRSPMAEFLMKDAVQKAGREKEFLIASTGVSDEDIWGGVGNPVYPPVRRILAERGISTDGKRATLLTEKDGGRYDYFLCMDEGNLRRAKRIVGKEHEGKCHLLLAFTGRDGSVADPWYTRDFSETLSDLVYAVEVLLQKL